MFKVAKFVVIIAENVFWMEDKAIHFYSDLFGRSSVLGEKYVEKNLSHQKLIKIQNDFSVEILMAYDDEVPLSFMKLNSSRLHNQNLEANKAIGIDHVVYFSPEDIEILFKRAEEVAKQRKHDLIWVETFEGDLILKEKLQSLGYEGFDFEEKRSEDTPQKQVYFKKAIVIKKPPHLL